MRDILKLVTKRMKEAGISYVTGRKKGRPSYPYFVGHLYHLGTVDESGRQKYELLLDGFQRGDDESLMYEEIDKLEKAFPPVSGYTAQTGHSVICCWYKELIPEIPDTDTELMRVQVAIGINYWKGET